jgi:hypothetical protein
MSKQSVLELVKSRGAIRWPNLILTRTPRNGSPPGPIGQAGRILCPLSPPCHARRCAWRVTWYLLFCLGWGYTPLAADRHHGAFTPGHQGHEIMGRGAGGPCPDTGLLGKRLSTRDSRRSDRGAVVGAARHGDLHCGGQRGAVGRRTAGQRRDDLSLDASTPREPRSPGGSLCCSPTRHWSSPETQTTLLEIDNDSSSPLLPWLSISCWSTTTRCCAAA